MPEETEATEAEQTSQPAETAAEQESAQDTLQAVELERLQDTGPANNKPADLETILDIFVSISVEIGQTRISIRDLLQLGPGSVVKLDRDAGKPLDVMVNNTLIAHGEVVVSNEKYGIRLTDIVNTQERIKKL